MKKNLILVMAGLLILCWYVTVGEWLGRSQKYEDALANARSFEERELYVDAIREYEAAMTYQEDDSELMMTVAEDYRKMGDDASYLSQLQKLVSEYGPQEDAVGKIYDYYISSGRERKAIDYISDLNRKYPDSDVVRGYYKLLQKGYTELYVSYQHIAPYYNGYAVYEYEGEKGIIDSVGDIVLKAAYDDIKIPENADDGFPVRVDRQTYYISEKGYKILQPEIEYEELGVLCGRRILAKKNGKYGYLDKNLKEKTEFIWDDATNFCEGTAAVRSGEKWALINTKGELLTDYIYSDIRRDAQNFCSRNGVIWVKESAGYRLINTKLEAVSEEEFDDVTAFVSEEPCAVRLGDRWGFADLQGQLVIPCQFVNARSFQQGYAPVSDGNLWGYAGSDGTLLIDYAFDDADFFNEKGIAPVMRENNWGLIQLEIYR